MSPLAMATNMDMLEILGAKRVRRQDLQNEDTSSDDGTPSPSIDNEDYFRLQTELFAQQFSIPPHSTDPITPTTKQQPPTHTTTKPCPQNPQPQHQPQPQQTFPFRLLSAHPSKNILPLTENDITNQTPHILNPRPTSHYIAPPPSPAQQARLAAYCLSGDEILALSKRPNWGMRMPWRVVSVEDANIDSIRHQVSSPPPPAVGAILLNPPAISNTTTTINNNIRPESKKKTRPNKKCRILLRKRLELHQAAQAEQHAKESRISEKKKRANRQKKLRAKAKKINLKEGVDVGGQATALGGDGGG